MDDWPPCLGTIHNKGMVVIEQSKTLDSRETASSAASELHSTYQLGSIVLRVRDDIDILVREYGGQPCFIIEDELTSQYFRIGAAEYTFLSLLDGSNTFASALGRTASIMKQDALTEDRAANFCKWLVHAGLASTEQSRSTERLVEHQQQGVTRRNVGRFSALSQRIPLIHPRNSIDVMHRMFGWLFSGPVALLYLLLVGYGTSAIVLQWERFTTSAARVISADNWIWLAGTWLVLKLVHESAHGVACRRFGGTVREAGLLLIVFIPLPYVDVSAAWRFASRWQRIIVSAAGMMAELAVAAVAAIIWSQSGPGLLSQNAVNVIFSASVMTVLFNANPLMRFDGYYILTDLLELPNLYTHGSRALLQTGRTWGLGLPSQPQEYPEGRARLILAYGIAAFVWRIVICVGLVLAADVLLYGLGTLLAACAVLAWLCVPVLRLLKFVMLGNKIEQPSRLRFACLAGGLAAATATCLTVVPWYSTTTAPLVVDYYPKLEVRSPASGFVEKIFAEVGQNVRAGDLLFVLRNDELETQLHELKLDIERSEHRALRFLDRKEQAAFQVEQESLVALRERLKELSKQYQHLYITAPADGVVLTARLDDSQGSYVLAGSMLVEIGSRGNKKLLAMVDQSEAESFREQVGHPINIHIQGTGSSWAATELTEVSMRATREFPHPALAAHVGGSLDVRISSSEDEHAENSRYELLEPHFLARAEIPSSLETTLSSGQTGAVAFVSNDSTIGHHLSNVLGAWWNKRQQAVGRQLYDR